MSAVVGIPVCIILIFLAPWIFTLLSTDPLVREIGTPYLQARMAGMTFNGMNFAFRGYWNGISRPRIYMRTIIAIHIAQITFSWVFIFGNLGAPELGALGAGIGTTLSIVFGSALYAIQAWDLAAATAFWSACRGARL